MLFDATVFQALWLCLAGLGLLMVATALGVAAVFAVWASRGVSRVRPMEA